MNIKQPLYKNKSKVKTLYVLDQGPNYSVEITQYTGIESSNQNDIILDLMRIGLVERDCKRRKHNKKIVSLSLIGKKAVKLLKERQDILNRVNKIEKLINSVEGEEG